MPETVPDLPAMVRQWANDNVVNRTIRDRSYSWSEHLSVREIPVDCIS